MSIRILSGERYNILATGESVTVTSENALFPKANLPDGRVDSAFRFSAATTEDTITVDGNLISNGSLDTFNGSVPQGWATDGAVSQSATSQARSGTAARLDQDGKIVKEVTVRAGQTVILDGFYSAATSGGDVAGILRNLTTGRRWSLGTSGWVDSGGFFLTTAATSTYAQLTKTVTVEDYDTVRSDTCVLQMELSEAGVGTVFLDDWYMWPAVDFASVHGHNIQANSYVRLRSSTDNFASTSNATDQAIMTQTQPSFYTVLSSAVGQRYWQLRISSSGGASFAQDSPVFIGELVIGQSYALARNFDYGSELRFVVDTLRGGSPASGSVYVHRVGQRPRRIFAAEFNFFTTDEYREARQEVFERSFGDANPIVVVPSTDGVDVIHGRIDNSWAVRQSLTAHFTENALTVLESNFPVWTP